MSPGSQESGTIQAESTGPHAACCPHCSVPALESQNSQRGRGSSPRDACSPVRRKLRLRRSTPASIQTNSLSPTDSGKGDLNDWEVWEQRVAAPGLGPSGLHHGHCRVYMQHTFSHALARDKSRSTAGGGKLNSEEG